MQYIAIGDGYRENLERTIDKKPVAALISKNGGHL